MTERAEVLRAEIKRLVMEGVGPEQIAVGLTGRKGGLCWHFRKLRRDYQARTAQELACALWAERWLNERWLRPGRRLWVESELKRENKVVAL